MNKMILWRKFLQEEKGASATEYAVMIALILLVVLATIVVLGQEVTGLFANFASLVAPFFSGGT